MKQQALKPSRMSRDIFLSHIYNTFTKEKITRTYWRLNSQNNVREWLPNFRRPKLRTYVIN